MQNVMMDAVQQARFGHSFAQLFSCMHELGPGCHLEQVDDESSSLI